MFKLLVAHGADPLAPQLVSQCHCGPTGDLIIVGSTRMTTCGAWLLVWLAWAPLQGLSPLHIAIEFGHADLVSTIVRTDPRSLNTVDTLGKGYTPLSWAITLNQTAIARQLLTLGANASQHVLHDVRCPALLVLLSDGGGGPDAGAAALRGSFQAFSADVSITVWLGTRESVVRVSCAVPG
jgi:hypothetical protein